MVVVVKVEAGAEGKGKGRAEAGNGREYQSVRSLLVDGRRRSLMIDDDGYPGRVAMDEGIPMSPGAIAQIDTRKGKGGSGSPNQACTTVA